MRARVKTAVLIDAAEALGLFRRLLPGPTSHAWSLTLTSGGRNGAQAVEGGRK